MLEAGAVKHIERELSGEPMQAGAYTLRPVAHLHARLEASGRESSDLAWGYARLNPVALIVDGPGGAVRRIAITNPDAQAARSLLWAGLLVAAISAATIVARRLAR
jgi:hypothetical protein